MKTRQMHNLNSSLRNQRGIATILIVVLVGVALTATAMGIMHSMRSTQEKHVAVHATTHAQTGLWSGVEALRRYLGSLTPAQLLALNGSTNLGLQLGSGNAFGNMSIKSVTVVENTNNFRVNATIVNSHGAANASAAVDVVFNVERIAAPTSVRVPAALDFHDDLQLGGNIVFNAPASASPIINVDGNIDASNISITGLGVLNATGTVTLGSGVQGKEVNSNGNVRLTQAAKVDKVSTRGTVVSDGNSGARVIWANGAVTLGGSYRSDAVNSRSTIDVTMGAHGNLKAMRDITVRNDATLVDEVQTKANVNVRNNATVTNIIAEGNLTCSLIWKRFTTASFNGIVQPACLNANEVTTAAINQSNTVTVMNEIEPISIPRFVIDVWTLKQHANYVFEWDSSRNRTKVTVNNISGVTNGTVFWVGNYAPNYNVNPQIPPKKSYLCSTFDASGNCLTPAAGNLGLCIGHSTDNECLSYNTTTKTWVFNGKNATPGILWFNGNVTLDNGYNYSTVLATGDVNTAGGMKIQSVNYAGFDAMCKAIAPHFPPTETVAKNFYKNMFEDQIPTNLCTGTNTYTPLDVGNIAIAAGGYNPAGNGAYSGGNIDLGASNEVFGIVLAGQYLQTAGETKVYGYVSAAVLGSRGTEDNSLSASTTVDLTRGSATYSPDMVPNMGGGACPNCQGMTGVTIGESKVLWSKYL